MQLDEWIFKALAASNVNWTAHVVESSNIKRGSTIDEMEDEIILLINKQLSDEVARGQEMEKQITRLSNEATRVQDMEKQIASLSNQMTQAAKEMARGQEMEKQIASLSNQMTMLLQKNEIPNN